MIENFVIIIGAMKAGTTTLFDQLADHPAIAPANPKEPGFFAFENIYARGLDWYDGLFGFDPAIHTWALEASTDYTKYPHAKAVPQRLAETGRRFKLIYIVRHPLKRMQSHAKHTQHWRKELGQIVSPISDHGLDQGISSINLDASRYAMQLDQYQDYYERGDLLLIPFEGMISNASQVMERVSLFLSIDQVGLPDKLKASNTAGAVQRSEEPGALWRAARAVTPFRLAAKALIPEDMRARWRKKTRPRVEVEGRFELTAEEAETYLDQLRPDLIRLRDVYHFDVQKWWSIEI